MPDGIKLVGFADDIARKADQPDQQGTTKSFESSETTTAYFGSRENGGSSLNKTKKVETDFF